MRPTEQNFSRLRADFMAVSIALSVGHDHGRLLEIILNRTRLMAGADGGTSIRKRPWPPAIDLTRMQ